MERLHAIGASATGRTVESPDGDGASAEAGTDGTLHLTEAVRRVMAERGLTTREVVGRFPERHLGTAYRILAGRTTDPWSSTVVQLCGALEVDPNDLLGAIPSPLAPELDALLSEARALTEDDRWLIVDLLRSVRQSGDRHAHAGDGGVRGR